MTSHPFPAALARFGGNEKALAVTAMMIAEDAPTQLAKVVEALAADQSEPAAFAAHTLKGMLSTFDDGDAVSGLQKIEDSAKNDDIDQASKSLTDCKVKIESLISDIHQIANRQI